MEINYLKHLQIDKPKWDLTIENSKNGLVYALSWYLDIVCPNWDALVSGDYEFVMPLPTRQKLGNKILYQPVFSHQLGIFSKYEISPEIVNLFLIEATKHYKFIDIKLNNNNPAPDQKLYIQRQTQTLDLNKKYNF